MASCTNWLSGRYCGATDDVHQYLPGDRCPRCTPAALAGRPESIPDPDATLVALTTRKKEAPRAPHP